VTVSTLGAQHTLLFYRDNYIPMNFLFPPHARSSHYYRHTYRHTRMYTRTLCPSNSELTIKILAVCVRIITRAHPERKVRKKDAATRKPVISLETRIKWDPNRKAEINSFAGQKSSAEILVFVEERVSERFSEHSIDENATRRPIFLILKPF